MLQNCVVSAFLNSIHIGIAIRILKVVLSQFFWSHLFSLNTFHQIYFTTVVSVYDQKSSHMNQIPWKIISGIIESNQQFSGRQYMSSRWHFILHTQYSFIGFSNNSTKISDFIGNNFVRCSNCQKHLRIFSCRKKQLI